MTTPKGLTAGGLGYWRRLKKTMEDSGDLKTSDSYVLLLAAQTFEEYAMARDEIKKNGITLKVLSDRGAEIIKTNPAAPVMNQASARLLRILDKLGLTPGSRAKGKREAVDPIGDLMNG